MDYSLAETLDMLSDLFAVVGILFLCWQARLYLRQQRYDSLKSTHLETKSILSYALSDPSLLPVIGSSAPKAEMAKQRYLQMWFNHFHIAFHDIKRGVISSGNREAWERDIRVFVQSKPAADHWAEHQHAYEPDFRAWIDSLVSADN